MYEVPGAARGFLTSLRVESRRDPTGVFFSQSWGPSTVGRKILQPTDCSVFAKETKGTGE